MPTDTERLNFITNLPTATLIKKYSTNRGAHWPWVINVTGGPKGYEYDDFREAVDAAIRDNPSWIVATPKIVDCDDSVVNPSEHTPITKQLRSKKDRFFSDFVLMEKAANEIDRLNRALDAAENRIKWIKERVCDA